MRTLLAGAGHVDRTVHIASVNKRLCQLRLPTTKIENLQKLGEEKEVVKTTVQFNQLKGFKNITTKSKEKLKNRIPRRREDQEEEKASKKIFGKERFI